MICTTPLDTKTSDCMILAVALELKLGPMVEGNPTVMKFPLEFDTNVKGSPEADICVIEELASIGQ